MLFFRGFVPALRLGWNLACALDCAAHLPDHAMLRGSEPGGEDPPNRQMTYSGLMLTSTFRALAPPYFFVAKRVLATRCPHKGSSWPEHACASSITAAQSARHLETMCNAGAGAVHAAAREQPVPYVKRQRRTAGGGVCTAAQLGCLSVRRMRSHVVADGHIGPNALRCPAQVAPRGAALALNDSVVARRAGKPVRLRQGDP